MRWITSILNKGGKVYEVGGCVRDSLLRRASKDIDYLVCGLPMDDLVDLLQSHGRADLVGQSFGVIKFKPTGCNETFDVALPRTEVSTGDGHKDFSVEYDCNLPVEKDLERRDFTINAIARDLSTGELVDPFGGVADIRSKVIRLVNEDAFIDDPLRMLRAVQFQARFDMRLDPALLVSMQINAHRIDTVSPERISMELVKLLKADSPSIGFELMWDAGLLDLILPELGALRGVAQPAKYHDSDAWGHTMAVVDNCPSDDINVRLTCLLHDIAKKQCFSQKDDGTIQFIGHDKLGATMARDVLERLRFSVCGVNADRVCKLIQYHMTPFADDCADKSIRKFVSKLGPDLVFDWVRVKIADSQSHRDGSSRKWLDWAKRYRTLDHGKVAVFSVKSLAVNGQDIMTALGCEPGPHIGAALQTLFQAVLDEQVSNDRDSLLEFLKTV